MGTMLQYEVTVFDPASQLGVPVRFLTHDGMEQYIKQTIRLLDSTLDTDVMDFAACQEALKYLNVTVTMSKIKVPMEDLL